MKNTEKFLGMIEDIAGDNEYVVDHFVDVAEKNGYTNLNDLSDDEYKEIEKKFVNEQIIPSLGKALSNTDQKTETEDWDNFSGSVQRANKYIKNDFNRNYEQLKKAYGEDTPLLKLANDKEKLSVYAAQFGTTPDILKKEIENAWEEQKKVNFDKAEKERIEETQDNRQKLWNDFQGGKFDGEVPFLGKPLRLFAVNNPWGRDVMEQNKRNVINGTDESNLDDAAISVGTEVGKIMLGNGFGGKFGEYIGSRAATKYAGALTGIGSGIGQGFGFGIGNALGQFSRKLNGTQQDFNLGKAFDEAREVALIGGTAGGILGGVSGIGGSKISRLVSRKLRSGVDYDDPLIREQNEFKATIENAKNLAKGKNKSRLANDEARVAEQKAAKYEQDPRIVNSNKRILEKLQAEQKSTPAPKKEKVDLYAPLKTKPVNKANAEQQEPKKIELSKAKGYKKYPDELPTKRQYSLLKDPAQRDKLRELYPETIASFSEKPVGIGTKAIVSGITNAIRGVQIIGGNIKGQSELKTNDEKRIEDAAEYVGVNKTQIRIWDAGFVPHKEDENYKRYKQFKRIGG